MIRCQARTGLLYTHDKDAKDKADEKDPSAV
jgi:hypothetical protein